MPSYESVLMAARFKCILWKTMATGCRLHKVVKRERFCHTEIWKSTWIQQHGRYSVEGQQPPAGIWYASQLRGVEHT